MVEIKRDIINWVEEVLESSDDEQYLLIVPPAPTLNKHVNENNGENKSLLNEVNNDNEIENKYSRPSNISNKPTTTNRNRESDEYLNVQLQILEQCKKIRKIHEAYFKFVKEQWKFTNAQRSKKIKLLNDIKKSLGTSQ